MALFRRNTLPHPMKNVSWTVLVDVQSKLSGGSLWAKTMMWLCKVHMILPPLWHSWCQPHQCCMRRKLTSTILQGVWIPGMTCRPLPNLLVRQMHAAEYSLWAGWHCTGNFSRGCWLQREIWEVNNASSSGLLLDMPQINLERFHRRAFTCAGPTLWNNLPTNLRVYKRQPHTIQEAFKDLSIFHLMCLYCSNILFSDRLPLIFLFILGFLMVHVILVLIYFYLYIFVFIIIIISSSIFFHVPGVYIIFLMCFTAEILLFNLCLPFIN